MVDKLPPDPKPMCLTLNRDQAALLKKGLTGLPSLDQKNANYQALMRDIDMIVVIWDRTIKNQQIVKEMLKQQKAAKAKEKK